MKRLFPFHARLDAVRLASCLVAGTAVHAQQSLFNVPSSDITEKDHWFFQEQLNLGPGGVSNTTVDYGIGHNWEVGFNLFDVDLYHPATSEAVATLPLLNLQTRIDLAHGWALGIGSQVGPVSPRRLRDIQLANLDYINSPIRLGEWGTGFVGGYFANAAYTGSRPGAGFMLGADIPLLEKKLHFMADYMHGSTALGVGVVGFVFYLPKGWQISAGAQLPAPGSHNDYGLVLEFTHL